MHLLALQECGNYMIISHMADIGGVKRVEKVLARYIYFSRAVQTVLEKWQKHHVFTMEKWQTLMYTASPVLMSMLYRRDHLQ